MALLVAAGCRDSYPPALPPLDRFYYPSGLGVHTLPPQVAGGPERSALVVVSTNFDLQYNISIGGTVISVDPDASDDTLATGQLAVLGTPVNIGSFGGEVAIAEPACTTAWPGCPSLCPSLGLAAGTALVATTSRDSVLIYTMGIDSLGSLTCGTSCETTLPPNTLDPYGVELVCNASQAVAYVTQLRALNYEGQVSRLDLATGALDTVLVASPVTYTSAFDPSTGFMFLGTQLGPGQPPVETLRWFNLSSLPNVEAGATEAPAVGQIDVATYFRAAIPMDMAVSSDGSRLYADLEQVDADLLLVGSIVPKAGALAVFDLTLDSSNQPSMLLVRAVNTCLGLGQVRILPPRAGKRDLVAVTCDAQGALVLYDDDAGKVVSQIGLDPGTGQPLLGREPFGIAVEAIDPARRTPFDSPPPPPAGSTPAYSWPPYGQSPCVEGDACVRLYVASFAQSFVNILELDPAHPENMQLVKRIGIESEP